MVSMVGSLLHTLTGSVYEFDVRGRAARRLGNHDGQPPTPNLGRDGAWRLLERIAMHPSPDGIRVHIVWRVDTPGFRSTLLSAALDPRELDPLAPLVA